MKDTAKQTRLSDLYCGECSEINNEGYCNRYDRKTDIDEHQSSVKLNVCLAELKENHSMLFMLLKEDLKQVLSDYEFSDACKCDNYGYTCSSCRRISRLNRKWF